MTLSPDRNRHAVCYRYRNVTTCKSPRQAAAIAFFEFNALAQTRLGRNVVEEDPCHSFGSDVISGSWGLTL
jgi:hypothetical protein